MHGAHKTFRQVALEVGGDDGALALALRVRVAVGGTEEADSKRADPLARSSVTRSSSCAACAGLRANSARQRVVPMRKLKPHEERLLNVVADGISSLIVAWFIWQAHGAPALPFPRWAKRPAVELGKPLKPQTESPAPPAKRWIDYGGATGRGPCVGGLCAICVDCSRCRYCRYEGGVCSACSLTPP
jgi:hypothetical protein